MSLGLEAETVTSGGLSLTQTKFEEPWSSFSTVSGGSDHKIKVIFLEYPCHECKVSLLNESAYGLSCQSSYCKLYGWEICTCQSCTVWDSSIFRISLVSLHMEWEVVTSWKLSLTQVTFEGLWSGVLPVVTGQLIRPGKLPGAAFPRALIGFLSCVGALVGLQVRALGVNFITVEKVALVDLSTFERVAPTAWIVFGDFCDGCHWGGSWEGF